MAITTLSQQLPAGAMVSAGLQKPEKVAAVAADPLAQVSGQEAEAAEEKKAGALDAAKLREMVDQANKAMEAKQVRLQFSIHEETGSQVVQVYDRDTDKLLRQYPPEEYLSVAEQIQEMSADSALSLNLKVEA